MFGRKQLAIVVAEFLGTGALALVVLSVQHSTIGLPYFMALLAGLTVAVMYVALGRFGGAHFNPAVTIGMWTVRQIKTIPAVAYIVAQMLGAWGAYYLYTYLIKTSLQPIGGHYNARVMVAEAVGAFIFSLAWAAAVYHRYWSAKAAATIGAGFVLAIVVAASASIGIVNPAVAQSMRAFGVFSSMGWGTYVLGPVLGAVLGFNVYALLFAPENALIAVGSSVSRRFGQSTPAPVAASAAKPATRRTSRSRRRGRPARK